MKRLKYCLIVLVLCVATTAFGQQKHKTITLSLTNVTVKAALTALKAQSGLSYWFNTKDVDLQKVISVDLKSQSIDDALKAILKGQNVRFEQRDDHIVIYKGDVYKQKDNLSQASKPGRITGRVLDSNGNPLPGVTVAIQGTTRGTITDNDGKYTISNVSPNQVLEFSFVGMQRQKISVGNKQVINVTLKESVTGLNEVVVIGYGTKLRGQLTGSVSTLGSTKIESKPVTGTMSALEGLISGVRITHTSGQPGQQNYSLSIRGISSINGNHPLILIDGVPGDINLLNPNDIKTVTVLKDASAAIYGARAADGVILITTKSGKKSAKPVVSYSVNVGMKQPDFLKKPTPTLHFVLMFNQANANDGDPQTFSNSTIAKIKANSSAVGPGENWSVTSYPMWYRSKDYYKDLFKNSVIQSHNLSISGGNNRTTYFLSGNFTNNQGNLSVGSNFSDKYSYRVNVKTKLWKHFTVNAIVSYEYQYVLTPSAILDGAVQDDALDNALKVFTYVPEFNPAGNYYSYQGYENPFQHIVEGGYQTTNDARLNNNLRIVWKPLRGLTWTAQGAINTENYRDKTIFSTFTTYNWDNSINGLPRNDPDSAHFYNRGLVYKNFSTYINYNRIIAEKHSFKLMVGASREKNENYATYMRGANFYNNHVYVLPLSNPKDLTAGSGYYWNNDSWALLSYFGRFSYSYNSKYYLDVTIRKDGSSKFSPVKRWSGTYPSVALAWKLSEEPFFKSIIPNKIMNLFKIRASWGRMGNQDISALGLFDYYQIINVGGQYPIDGSTISQTAAMQGIASPDRTWETIQTKNLGFDLGFFHSKLTASFDIYQKKNLDMLVSVNYPATLGATAPSTNAGTLLIHGWELQSNWKGRAGAFQYSAGFILDYNSDILTNLQGNDSYSIGLNFARQGYPMDTYFGYKGKIIRTQAQLDAYAAKYAGKGIVPATQPNGQKGLGIGDVMYQDVNGDGKITTADAVNLGSSIPKYTYSFNASLKYKNFDLGVIINGTGNKYDWRGNGNFGVPLAHFWFQPLDYFYGKTFSKSNPNAPYPRLSNSGPVKDNNFQFSNIWLVNTRYLRVRNITFGYDIPRKFLKKLRINSARIYFSGENLFTISPGTWGKEYDPEESDVEYNYPFYKTYSLGFNVNF